MRVGTFLGYLAGLGAVVVVSYLSVTNRELLTAPFGLGSGWSVPLYLIGLLLFLVGLLPPATILLVQTLKRDLAQRRARRASRHEVSLDQVFRRAVDYQADSQLGRALGELEVYLEARPDDFAGLLRYGQILRELDRRGEALEAHQKAASLYPASVAVLYELIEDYERNRQPEVAMEIRNRIARDFPDRGVRVRRWRRNQAIARGDWKTATRDQEEIDALLEGQPDEFAAHRDRGVRLGLTYERAVSLFEIDRVQDAIEIIGGILEEEPDFLPARILLGEAYLEVGDESAALDVWRQGFDETGSPVFLQRLEDHFIEQEDPMRAIETLREIIAQASNDVLARFFLGRLYYRLEMLEEAERTLQPLGESVEKSPTYHFILARIRERRGEMGRAASSYRRCVRQLGLATSRFRCRSCGTSWEEWHDRCDRCGLWNSVELALEHEQLDPGELGVVPTPVWGELDSEKPE